MIVLRREVGDVLRGHRQAQGRTLREISASAAVSLGYLSEVERGEKEASSELLASICAALHLPMSQMLSDVSDRAAESEAVSALVTLPMPQRPESLVSAYRRESQRQKLLIRKARLCDAKLVFIVTAFNKLLADDNFIILLRAESLANMPKYVHDKITINQKEAA